MGRVALLLKDIKGVVRVITDLNAGNFDREVPPPKWQNMKARVQYGMEQSPLKHFWGRAYNIIPNSFGSKEELNKTSTPIAALSHWQTGSGCEDWETRQVHNQYLFDAANAASDHMNDYINISKGMEAQSLVTFGMTTVPDIEDEEEEWE